MFAVDERITAVEVALRKLEPPVPYEIASAGVRLTVSPVRAYLGLGSNLGDREQYLRAALGAIQDVVAVSSVYETDPVGGPAGQGSFLNMVVAVETEKSPRELLDLCRRLEAAAGRVRAERWGPRTLDVDVLLVGDVGVDEPDLVVPHPRWRERAFVVEPLREVADPALRESLPEPDPSGVRRIGPLRP